MRETISGWNKDKSVASGLFGDIGQLMEGIFDGTVGERFRNATSRFCMNQQHALDALRLRYSRTKDDPLSTFLTGMPTNSSSLEALH